MGSKARASRKMAWPPNGTTTGTPASSSAPPQILGRTDPVSQIVLVDRFGEPLRHRLEVAPGQAPIGGEPLGEDLEPSTPFGKLVVIERQPPAHIGQRVLFG